LISGEHYTSRQSLFTVKSSVKHEELIAALQREVELKLEKNERAIGFSLHHKEKTQ